MADSSSPSAVAAATFSLQRKGYDQAEVRALLQQVASSLSKTQAEQAELARELAAAQAEIAHLRTHPPAASDLDESVVSTMLGAEAARVLTTAREGAASLRARVEAEVAAAREAALAQIAAERAEAATQIADERASADADVAALRAGAAATAEAEMESAKTQGREMVLEARAYRERVMADLARRREVAGQQIEVLRQQRARLRAAFSTVELSLGEIREELADDIADPAALEDPTGISGAFPVVAAVTAGMAPARPLISAALPSAALPSGRSTTSGSVSTPATVFSIGELPTESTVSPPPAPNDSTSAEVGDVSTPTPTEPEAPDSNGAPLDDSDDVAGESHSRSDDMSAGDAVRSAPVTPSVDSDAVTPAPEPDGGDDVAVLDGDPGDVDETDDATQSDVDPVDRPEPVVASAEPDHEEASAAGEHDPSSAGTDLADPTDNQTTALTSNPDEDEATPIDGAAVEAEQVDSVAVAAGPVDAVLPAAGSSSVDDRDVVSAVRGEKPSRPVDELFARIRAGRVQDVANLQELPTTTPVSTSAVAVAAMPAAVVPAGPSVRPTKPVRSLGLDAEAKAAVLRDRADALGPVEQSLSRRLKRVLADEQSEALDRLRRSKTTPAPEDLFGSAGTQAAAYREAGRDDLLQAARSGASSLATLNPQEMAEVVTAEDVIGHALDELERHLVSPLRSQMDSAVTAAGGDTEEAAAVLRAAYREWKVQRIDAAVGHIVLSAYGRGGLAALLPGTPVCWVVDETNAPCAEGEDNSLAGGVPCGEEFPTGHRSVPAYPGCRCALALHP